MLNKIKNLYYKITCKYIFFRLKNKPISKGELREDPSLYERAGFIRKLIIRMQLYFDVITKTTFISFLINQKIYKTIYNMKTNYNFGNRITFLEYLERNSRKWMIFRYLLTIVCIYILISVLDYHYFTDWVYVITDNDDEDLLDLAVSITSYQSDTWRNTIIEHWAFIPTAAIVFIALHLPYTLLTTSKFEDYMSWIVDLFSCYYYNVGFYLIHEQFAHGVIERVFCDEVSFMDHDPDGSSFESFEYSSLAVPAQNISWGLGQILHDEDEDDDEGADEDYIRDKLMEPPRWDENSAETNGRYLLRYDETNYAENVKNAVETGWMCANISKFPRRRYSWDILFMRDFYLQNFDLKKKYTLYFYTRPWLRHLFLSSRSKSEANFFGIDFLSEGFINDRFPKSSVYLYHYKDFMSTFWKYENPFRVDISGGFKFLKFYQIISKLGFQAMRFNIWTTRLKEIILRLWKSKGSTRSNTVLGAYNPKYEMIVGYIKQEHKYIRRAKRFINFINYRDKLWRHVTVGEWRSGPIYGDRWLHSAEDLYIHDIFAGNFALEGHIQLYRENLQKIEQELWHSVNDEEFTPRHVITENPIIVEENTKMNPIREKNNEATIDLDTIRIVPAGLFYWNKRPRYKNFCQYDYIKKSRQISEYQTLYEKPRLF